MGRSSRPSHCRPPKLVPLSRYTNRQNNRLHKLGCLAFSFELCLAVSAEPKMNISARRHGRRRLVHSFPTKIGSLLPTDIGRKLPTLTSSSIPPVHVTLLQSKALPNVYAETPTGSLKVYGSLALFSKG